MTVVHVVVTKLASVLVVHGAESCAGWFFRPTGWREVVRTLPSQLAEQLATAVQSETTSAALQSVTSTPGAAPIVLPSGQVSGSTVVIVCDPVGQVIVTKSGDVPVAATHGPTMLRVPLFTPGGLTQATMSMPSEEGAAAVSHHATGVTFVTSPHVVTMKSGAGPMPGTQ